MSQEKLAYRVPLRLYVPDLILSVSFKESNRKSIEQTLNSDRYGFLCNRNIICLLAKRLATGVAQCIVVVGVTVRRVLGLLIDISIRVK